MMEEITTHMARMEENQCKFWERLIKDQKELHQQMSQMMQMLKRMAPDKGIVDEDNIVRTVVLTQEATKDLEYPSPTSNSLIPSPQNEVDFVKEKDTRANSTGQLYMGYNPYQAYPNHPLHYPTLNPYKISSPKPKSPQPMVPIPDQVYSVPNFLLDHSK